MLPKGQTNQPLPLQSRVYGGGKKEKKQNRRETAQRIKGRRASSLREGPTTTKVQFQVRPESVATVRDSEREGWEPQNPAKHPRPQSPAWYGSSCSLELRNQFIGSQPSSAQNQIGRKHQISGEASIRRGSVQYQPVLKPRQSCYNKAKRICKRILELEFKTSQPLKIPFYCTGVCVCVWVGHCRDVDISTRWLLALAVLCHLAVPSV